MSLMLELGLELGVSHISYIGAISSDSTLCLSVFPTLILLGFFKHVSLSPQNHGQLHGRDQVSYLCIPLATIFTLKESQFC